MSDKHEVPDSVDEGAGQAYSDNLRELMAALRKYAEHLEPDDRIMVALTATIAVARPGGAVPLGNITNGFTYGPEEPFEASDAEEGAPPRPAPADVIQPAGDTHLDAARDDSDGEVVPEIEVVEVGEDQ